jgi:hypothetical protein
MTADGHFKVPTPVNEPVRAYAPGDPYRKSLKARLAELTDARTEVPMQIGGERRWGSSRADIRSVGRRISTTPSPPRSRHAGHGPPPRTTSERPCS